MKNRNFEFEPSTVYRHHNTSPENANKSEQLLTGWRKLTRHLVRYSNHQTTQYLIECCEQDITISMYYQGGTDSGRFRKFTPESVFRTEDSLTTYVTGYCHLRSAHRVLRTDRISLG